MLLSLLGVLVLFAAYQYFFVFRLSTRGSTGAVTGTAPEFALVDQTGATATLAALTARGPAVLVFYRGHW